MNLKFVLGSTLLVSGLILAAPAVHADTVTLAQTNVRAIAAPERGLSMSRWKSALAPRRQNCPLQVATPPCTR
jgi:hypothetical protein